MDPPAVFIGTAASLRTEQLIRDRCVDNPCPGLSVFKQSYGRDMRMHIMYKVRRPVDGIDHEQISFLIAGHKAVHPALFS